MERRQFLRVCTIAAGAAQLGSVGDAWAGAEPRLYGRSKLVDVHGAPIRLGDLALKTNYVFNYPYAGTPCFLLNLGRPVAAADNVLRADGASYAWTGGVGPEHSVVSYSAICAPTSDGNVIHCCADHSVYDPAAGARVVSGPAPQPLAAILLDYDGATDGVAALGTVGAEQFDAFFRKYDFKLTMEYGQGKARMPVGATTVVRELTQYCRQTIQC
jgi:Rieske Fe-S protein